MKWFVYLAIALFLAAMGWHARRGDGDPVARRWAWLWFVAAGLALATSLVLVAGS
ncbi:MAG TPA: hypothetical protein VM055_07260 [Novosphingobium sp.]|nr:hypothetical protein [Novosphingobium sp.]